MIKDTLVIIPARGGSKRITNKNIKLICKQPMICWPMMQLREIFYAKDILVSTDDKKIIDVVEKKGLNVPFVRPESLSDDWTGTAEVISHALGWYEKHVKRVEYVVTVYPTAVLLSKEDVVSATNMLKEDYKCDSVMSATSFPFPIQRAVFENSNGYAEMFSPENYSARSQDLVSAKHDAGQFYVNRASAVREGRILTNSKVKLYMLNRSCVIDIDTMEDFEIAEEKLKQIYDDKSIADWVFESQN